MTFRWGILSTGNMANSMAAAMEHVPDAQLIAVASRTQNTADKFAKRWGCEHAYDHFESLLANPDIDIVYIATPNAIHKDNILKALEFGKHILCEKPLTTSVEDLELCMGTARSKGLFLMEAIWTAFFPVMRKISSLVSEAAIGKIRHINAQFVSYRDPHQSPNLFDPKLGGGATSDLGIYPIAISQLFAGAITNHSAQTVTGTSGVDEMVVVSAQHENEILSTLSYGFRAEIPILMTITGDEGVIEIPQNFHKPDNFALSFNGNVQRFELPPIGNGYAHEILEVHDCIQNGKLESSVLPLSFSLRCARILDLVRTQPQ